MNDKATNSIAKARTKDRLANDANVHKRNKENVGRRNNNKSGLSSSSQSNVGQINSTGITNSNFFKNFTNHSLTTNSKKQQQALKVASKIPYINKFAKMAEKVSKLKEKVQTTKQGIAGLASSGDNKTPNAEEIEDAARAEQVGEEYKPDDTEKKYTGVTGRQTVILTIVIISGMIGAIAFLGVILMSAMTDTGGQYYLASRDNPSEEDLEKAYSSQEDGSDSSDNSGSSGSSTSSGRLKADGTYEADNDKYDSVVVLDSEPKPWVAINYWDNLNKDDFVYPKDSKTGAYLGAWPKNYKTIPTQLNGCKTYRSYFAWPATPVNGVYQTVYEHPGMDIMADFGTPVYSPVDGKILFSAWGDTVNKGSDETAYSVTIAPNNSTTFSGVTVNEIFMTHMSGIVNRCDWGECNKTVKKGELIGFVGTAAGSASSSGYAAHLHITLYPSGNYYGALGTGKTEEFYQITSGTARKACG